MADRIIEVVIKEGNDIKETLKITLPDVAKFCLLPPNERREILSIVDNEHTRYCELANDVEAALSGWHTLAGDTLWGWHERLLDDQRAAAESRTKSS